MSAGAAVSQLPWMWLVSRASGLMLLVLFSTVFVLGISTRLGTRLRSMPRFAVSELHRTLALFSVVLLALHVATAILDPYVSIGWWATVLPFTAHYRTLALGLGTLAVDLGAAVLITSLMRRRLGHRRWRAVHWLAYASWPLAFMHSLSAGNDMSIWWVAALVWGSGSAVALAVVDRVLFTLQSRKRTTQRSNSPSRPAIVVRPGPAMTSTAVLHRIGIQPRVASTSRLLPSEPWQATTLAAHLERHGALVHHPSSAQWREAILG